jgi:general secretion pathway protein N
MIFMKELIASRLMAKPTLVSVGLAGCLVVALVSGGIEALAVAPATGVDPHSDLPVLGERIEPRPEAGKQAQATQAQPVEPALSGNPLWAIPLRQLSATRERPLFAPSRRPPAAPAYQLASAPPPPPPKPAEPDRPQLSLVGTVASEDAEGIGVFLDGADKSVVRLKTGENHKGWVLRTVNRRSVVLAKGLASVELALPAPDLAKRDAPQPSLAAQPARPVGAPPDGLAALGGPSLPPAAVSLATPDTVGRQLNIAAPPVPTTTQSSSGGFTLPASFGLAPRGAKR